MFYHSPACKVECVSEYTFLISKKIPPPTTKKRQASKKAKKN